jgi:hypothetical protein
VLPVSIYMCVTGQYHKSAALSRPTGQEHKMREVP